MKNKYYISITIVSFIIGFMLFVQYNTVQNPTIRDTKNIWEIRNELSEELKTHSQLLEAISETNMKVDEYENTNDKDPEEILMETLDELKKEVGEEAVTGPGFILKIVPSVEAVQFGYEVEAIPPLLLTRLVNELNRNKAKYIEIDGHRLTLWSAIRDINGRTTVNGRPINKTDIEIKVIGNSKDEVQKLYNYILSSTLIDEFYIDNLNVKVGQVIDNLTISTTMDAVSSTYLKANE